MDCEKAIFFVQFIWRMHKRVKITSEPLEWRTSYPEKRGKQNRQFVERRDETFHRSVLPELCGEVKGERGTI